MKYVVIDNDGELHVKDGTWSEIDDLFRPEGWSGVRLPSGTTGGFRGVVNDVGLLMPEKFPRNIVGSLLLLSLYANGQPYAGPVVITGFITPVYEDPEHVSLRDDQVVLIQSIHADIRAALAGEGPPTPEEHSGEAWGTYCAAIAKADQELRDMPAPRMRYMGGADALAFLRGQS